MTERFKGHAKILGPIKYTKGRGSVPWPAQPLFVEGPIADIGFNGGEGFRGITIEIRGADGKDYEVSLDAETCRAIAIITPMAEG